MYAPHIVLSMGVLYMHSTNPNSCSINIWTEVGQMPRKSLKPWATQDDISLHFGTFLVVLTAHFCVFHPSVYRITLNRGKKASNTNWQYQSLNMVCFKRVLMRQLRSQSSTPAEEAAGCILSTHTYFKSIHAPVNNNVVSKTWHDLQRCFGYIHTVRAILWIKGLTWQMRHDQL